MKFMLSLVAATALMVGASFAEESPVTVAGAVTVSAEEAAPMFDAGVPFVDVRSDSDFEAGRIPGAVHLELKSNFSEETLLGVVAKDAPVVIYCNGHSCLRSADASEKAVGWGFTKVSYFRDGYPAWEAAGYAVE
jgi:rhodanese-related sulfurtransferase